MATTCMVCHQGEIQPGTTSYVFERDGQRLVVRDVPADVCGQCGEAWLDDRVAGQVLAMAAQARRAAERVVVSHYPAVSAAG